MRKTAHVVVSLVLTAMAVTAGIVLIEPVAAEIPSDVAADFNDDGSRTWRSALLARTTSPGS